MPNESTRSSGRFGLLATIAVGASALALTGCYATARYGYGYGTEIEGYAAVPVEAVPYDIEGYPHAYLGGSVAFDYHGDWYVPEGGRWYMLREEPRELRRYRTYAPSPYGYPARRYSYPPRYGYPPGYRVPPDYAYPPPPPVEPRYVP